MSNDVRIPHSLRIAIFLLRIAVGLNFFYLGWSALFNHALEAALRERSLGGLYGWLMGASAPFASIPSAAFAWLFLVIGVLLALGLFTRLAAIIGAVLTLASWLPSINFASFNPAQFVNDDAIVLFALAIIIFGKAGTYLGVDKFLRWSRRHRE